MEEKRKINHALSFFILLTLATTYFSSCLSTDKTNSDTAQNAYNQKIVEGSLCVETLFQPYRYINAEYDSLNWVAIELKNELTLINTGIFSVDIAGKQTEVSKNLRVILLDFQPCLKSLRKFNSSLGDAHATYRYCSDIEDTDIDSPYYYRAVAGNIQIEAKEDKSKEYRTLYYFVDMQNCMFKHDIPFLNDFKKLYL